jgi:hypothetical protein
MFLKKVVEKISRNLKVNLKKIIPLLFSVIVFSAAFVFLVQRNSEKPGI